MTDLRTAAQQALEALENCGGLTARDARQRVASITALRAALSEPVQEPVESALQAVAEKIGDQCAVWYGIGARDVEEVLREAARYGLVHGALAQPQEPVAWRWRLRSPTDAPGFAQPWNVTTYYPREQANEIEPLYTAPPQRKPLTREAAIALWADKSDGPSNGEIVGYCRAIERAHGIKEGT